MAISAGRTGRHSLAVDTQGRVWAWGANNTKQCGRENTSVNFHEPIEVGASIGWNTVAVEAGVKHSLALDDEGHVHSERNINIW